MHSELKTMLAEAKPFAPPNSNVVPLLREAEKPLPYPSEALPDVIRLAVESYQDYGQQPIEMVAMSALSMVSLACQGLANVARDRKLVSPLSLNMMVAADSGERKSSGDQTFSAAAHEWQKAKKEEMKLWETDNEFLSKQKTIIEKKKEEWRDRENNRKLVD